MFAKIKNRVARVVVLGFSIYIFIGFIHCCVSLYCYNVKNWDIFGGFSLPPLFVIGFFFDLFLWPLHLWASFINNVGIFGDCF